MTEALSEGPQSPGTIKEYAMRLGYDAIDGRILAQYSTDLAEYRRVLAETRGITLDQLHHGPLADMSRIATRSFASEQNQTEAA